jgi:hypothetical protein
MLVPKMQLACILALSILLLAYQKCRRRRMARKVRGDKRVGNLEKDLGLPPGTVRNKDGRDTRSDKKVETIRKELEK